MPSIDHLFVYGTLRRGFGHAMHHVLTASADPAGHAVAPGTLFDLGPYPGLWLGDRPDPGVHGELYRLRPDRAAETLDRLDEYEGVRAAEVDGCLYRRAAIDVRQDRRAVTAWVYLLTAVPTRSVLIPGGDYLAWITSGGDSGRAPERGSP